MSILAQINIRHENGNLHLKRKLRSPVQIYQYVLNTYCVQDTLRK